MRFRSLAVGLLVALGVAEARASVAGARSALRFEPNVGQTDPSVRFVARDRGQTVFLTDEGATIVLRSPGRAAAAIRMRLLGAGAARPVAEGRLGGTSNYLLGRDPAGWKTGVPAFGAVRYEKPVPGADLVFHGGSGRLEYDLELSAGTDAGAITVAFEGQQDLYLDGEGNLVLVTAAGELVQRRPVGYEEVGGTRTAAPVSCVVEDRSRVRFVPGPHAASEPLTIDPVLSASSYLGGSLGDAALAVALDAAGGVYLAGQTDSLDFPATPGAFQSAGAGGTDAFVTRLSPGGASVVFSTYLGGSSADVANGVAVGPGGSVFVAGETQSIDFPTTAGAFQPANPGRSAGFVTRLDSSGGVLVYSTYLGGGAATRCNAVAVDASGQACVVGRTSSHDLPTTAGAAFPTYRGGQFDGYVAKLNAAGSALVFSTFLGGSGNDALFGVAVGPGNAVCVAGGSDSSDYPTTPSAFQSVVQDTDAVVTMLDAGASSLVYSTFLGGSSAMERANAIAVDAAGRLHVAGFTPSADFPTKNAFQPVFSGGNDAWVAAFDPASSGAASLLYSTFLGGNGNDRANALAVDSSGRVWVAGQTSDAANFPLVEPLQSAYGGGASDAFVAQLTPEGQLSFSTLLGGSGGDGANAVAARGRSAAVAGVTDSADFPTMAPVQAANAGGSDAFFAVLETPAAASVPALSPLSIAALAAALATAGLLLARRA